MTERRVELVRLERPEAVYDVEEVLGRDARSVFPTQKAAAEAAAAEASSGKLDTDSVRERLGGRKFVTESELEAIKASRGGAEEVEVLKPLVEVLREAKEKKDQDFANGWKQMKQGKNRPLDEDELQFLDSIADAEAARARQQAEEERRELDEFRRATAEAQAQAELSAQTPAAGPLPQPLRPDIKRPAPALKPVIRAVVRPKGSAAQPAAALRSAPTDQEPAQGLSQGGEDIGSSVEGQAAKRQRTGEGGPGEKDIEHDQDEKAAEGLSGLLGGYGSSGED